MLLQSDSEKKKAQTAFVSKTIKWELYIYIFFTAG